jgi:hypothetical protein
MSNDSGTRKQPYTSPRLIVYGDIQQLTQATMMGTLNDGGAMLMNRTG